MKQVVDDESIDEILKGADKAAKRKAFRHNMPYAILQDGNVVLVYPDDHTEIATQKHLEDLEQKDI